MIQNTKFSQNHETRVTLAKYAHLKIALGVTMYEQVILSNWHDNLSYFSLYNQLQVISLVYNLCLLSVTYLKVLLTKRSNFFSYFSTWEGRYGQLMFF